MTYVLWKPYLSSRHLHSNGDSVSACSPNAQTHSPDKKQTARKNMRYDNVVKVAEGINQSGFRQRGNLRVLWRAGGF